MWAWVQRANRLRPPQELADFHEARFNACAKQFGPDGEVLGPNPEAQASFDQEVAIVDSTQADIRRTLIDLGCLTEEDVLSGRRRLEALARASAYPGIEPNSMTPSVYALACADMMRTARRFNAQDAVFAPFIEWWRHWPLRLEWKRIMAPCWRCTLIGGRRKSSTLSRLPRCERCRKA